VSPVFAYPKTRHARTQSPPAYKSYSSFKPVLRAEFEARCVYCRVPDGIQGDAAFGVDHYRPKHRFPALQVEYLNLYYCCNACNSRKGGYWPAPDVEAEEFIPNPCDHEMFAHLRYRSGEVEARSRAGEFAVELLDLNDPVTVSWRAAVLTAVDALRSQRAEAERKLAAIGKRQAQGKMTEAQAIAARARLDAAIANATSALSHFGAD
jgi:hypothetical protein